jgi:hypothetical protein
MFKMVLLMVLIISVSSICSAADVALKWDPSLGATGYKIQKSLDLGVTWLAPIDVGNVTLYLYTGVEEGALILFRVSAYNAAGEGIRTWSGAWFDFRKKPVLPPSGVGVQ